MSINRKIPGFIIFIILLLNAFSVLSQSMNQLYTLLPNNSREIDKALGAISEAGKLTQEANTYYNEALELQSNYDLDEKTLQKEVSKAEEKAISLQFKADKLYAEAYESLYNVCLNTLKSSSVSYGDISTYEASAAEMMEEAGKKRKEAAGQDNPSDKAELLNDAAGLEGAAIENMIFALQIQSGAAPEQTLIEEPTQDVIYQEQEAVAVVAPAITQKNENLSIDESSVSQYNSYVNDSSIPDPVTFTRAGVSGISDPSLEAAMGVFYTMHTGNELTTAVTTTPDTEDQQAVIADSVVSLAQTTTQATGQTTTETTADVSGKGLQPGTGIGITYTPQSSGVRFMVQLAASRAPLTRAQLWAIYPGKHTVEVIKESGWYKYRVTNFRLFSDANKVALESGVKTAFVISTDGQNRISVVDAREMTRAIESDVKTLGRDALKDGTDFYVQLLASRLRLTDEDRLLYCGPGETCREIIEEGWYKYQVYAGTDYQQAVSLKSKINAKTFIVAYEQGMKIKLYKASIKSR
jgi:hypothetical protein